MLLHEEEEEDKEEERNNDNGINVEEYRSGYALPYIIHQRQYRTEPPLTQESNMMNPTSTMTMGTTTTAATTSNLDPSVPTIRTSSAPITSTSNTTSPSTSPCPYYYGRVLPKTSTPRNTTTTTTSTTSVRQKLETYLQKTAWAILELQGKIYKMEETYHDDTYGHGNIYRGLEPLLDCKLGVSATLLNSNNNNNNTGVGTTTNTSGSTTNPIHESSCLSTTTSTIGSLMTKTSTAPYITTMGDTTTTTTSIGTSSGIKRRMAMDDRWFSSSCGIPPHASSLSNYNYNYNTTNINTASSTTHLGTTKTKRGRSTTATTTTTTSSTYPNPLVVSSNTSSATTTTTTTNPTSSTSTHCSRQAWALSCVHGTTTVSFLPNQISTDDEATPNTHDISTTGTTTTANMAASADTATVTVATKNTIAHNATHTYIQSAHQITTSSSHTTSVIGINN